jgi:hypothetical protein
MCGAWNCFNFVGPVMVLGAVVALAAAFRWWN